MAVKKATVEDAMKKVEESKKAPAKAAAKETKATAAKETKAAAKETKTAAAKETKAAATKETKATATKTAAKKPAVKKVAEVKEEVKAVAEKAVAKKPAAKKTATKKVESVFVEFAGGQVSTADLIAKATEASGKKSIKTLNVYYQPENGMVYYTADGEEGSFAF